MYFLYVHSSYGDIDYFIIALSFEFSFFVQNYKNYGQKVHLWTWRFFSFFSLKWEKVTLKTIEVKLAYFT